MSSNITEILDNAAGKAQKAQGESLNTFLASLTTSGIILGLGVISYIFLKSSSQQTRWWLDSGWKPASLSPRMLFQRPDLPHASGLDNYFFDRYLHTVTKIFFLLVLIIPPILIPLNVVDGKNKAGGVKGLDRLSFSNVGLSHTDRYWVHLGIAILVVALVCHVLQHEVREYTRIQSTLNVSPLGVSKSSLLISSSIQRLSSKEIYRHFHNTAGGIRSITSNRDYSSLRAKIRRRDALLRKLEIAETALIMKANYNQKLARTKDKNVSGYGHPLPLWTKYIDEKDRPLVRLSTFPRLPPLPFIGAQVDAIYHFRREVAHSNVEIEWGQQHPDIFPLTNSFFVHFNGRISTQLATLALKVRSPPSWTLKHGTLPSDTIWAHVSTSWWQHCTRTALVYLLVAMLTFGFAVPVTIIGSLSQIKYLASVVSWLQWVGILPNWLVAVIQGVLPPVLLAIVTTAVPSAIRLLANIEGLHSRQATENHVQIYYFAFLFIQGFLTISLSAGITTIIGELTDTIQAVPAILAQNLPKACNYFFSYIIINTFTAIVSILIQANQLLNTFVLSRIFDKTARQKWVRENNANLRKWGTFIPVFTNIACIGGGFFLVCCSRALLTWEGLIYSVIAPLILVFSIVYFGALWILYRSYPPRLTELHLCTSGLFYPTAIRQLFTGIYFMELCLAGLFFLVRDANGRAACTAQAVIMILVTALTALFHYTLDRNHWIGCFPLLEFLKRRMDRIGSQGKTQPISGCRVEVNEPSTLKVSIFQADLAQDEALRSSGAVVWIPKDVLGIADDEISHVRRTHDSMWISNEGASIDERGKLKVWGPPPRSG